MGGRPARYRRWLLALAIIAAAFITGCGAAADRAPSRDVAGRHRRRWPDRELVVRARDVADPAGVDDAGCDGHDARRGRGHRPL